MTPLYLEAQVKSKRDLLGIYKNDMTEGWLNVTDEDGSELEIAPGVQQTEYLILKRCGRMKWEEMNGMMPMAPTYRGRWKWKNDTVSIRYKQGNMTMERQFSFREPVYLEALDKGASFRKSIGTNSNSMFWLCVQDMRQHRKWKRQWKKERL